MILKYIGKSNLGNAIYKDTAKDGTLYIDTEFPKDLAKPIALHTMSSEYEEPDFQLDMTKFEFLVEGAPQSNSQKDSYMLLGRMKSDLDAHMYPYNNVWIENWEEYLDEIQALYNSLEVKPDWCTQDDLGKYAERLKNSPRSYDEAVIASNTDMREMNRIVKELESGEIESTTINLFRRQFKIILCKGEDAVHIYDEPNGLRYKVQIDDLIVALPKKTESLQACVREGYATLDNESVMKLF